MTQGAVIGNTGTCDERHSDVEGHKDWLWMKKDPG